DGGAVVGAGDVVGCAGAPFAGKKKLIFGSIGLSHHRLLSGEGGNSGDYCSTAPSRHLHPAHPLDPSLVQPIQLTAAGALRVGQQVRAADEAIAVLGVVVM